MKAAIKQTMAYDARSSASCRPRRRPSRLRPSRPKPAPELAKPTPDSEDVVVSTTPYSAGLSELLHSRDEEPTKDSPAPSIANEPTTCPRAPSEAVAEVILLARLEELKVEIANRSKGKLVNMALFDHRWSERPERPPLVSLQWKDWGGAAHPVVSRGRVSVPPVTEAAAGHVAAAGRGTFASAAALGTHAVRPTGAGLFGASPPNSPAALTSTPRRRRHGSCGRVTASTSRS